MTRTKKRLAPFITVLTLFLSAAAWGQIEFYVATDGLDTNPGTIDQPFATLTHAKQAVHDLIAAQGLNDDIVVILRGGSYTLAEPLAFGAEDSGTADHTITYRSAIGEEVHVIGGIEFPTDWFVQLTDSSAYASRLKAVDDPNVVYMADLKTREITDYGTLSYRGESWDGQAGPMELFVNYQPMQLGRWPNASYEMADEEVYGHLESLSDKQFFYVEEYEIEEEGKYESGDNRPQRWTQAQDKLIHGYFESYKNDIIVPFSVNTHSLIITLPSDSGISMEWYEPADHQWDWYPNNNDVTPAFYFMNLLEEIDQPGEWYLERSTGKLFLYPPENFSDAVCHLSMVDTLLQFDKASHINFEGLILEICRQSIVQITGGDSVRFYRCTLRNAGADAASIEGTNCGLDSCAVYDNGDGGVNLTGGDRTSLTAGNNYLRNSHVHNLSRWAHAANPAAQMADSCGMIATHNFIHDLPGSAIVSSRCNDNTIGYNAIHHVCWETDDTAAIYLDRYWTGRGSDIYNNFLYDIALYPVFDEEEHFGGWPFRWSNSMAISGNDGICLDTAASGNSIYGNIFYNIERHGVTIDGGRNNEIANNIFAYFEWSQVYLNRLFSCEDSIGIYTAATTMLDYYDYMSPPWSEHYPELVTLFSDDPNQPKYNTLARNISYGTYSELAYEGSDCDEDETNFLIQTDNAYADSPFFVDEPNMNLNLVSGSAAQSVPGWNTIPFDQIGTVPAVDEIQISLLNCSEIEVRGSCPPWAQINEVIAGLPKIDATEYVTVLDNGAIYGRIPRNLFGDQIIGIWLNVIDPQGHVSDWIASSQLSFSVLHNSTQWPESISIQAGQTLDIPLPVLFTDVEFTLTGLPESTLIDERNHLIWPTTLADANDVEYAAGIKMTRNNGASLDCACITIAVSDTPLKPQIKLVIRDCDSYTVQGQCDPWAVISSAVIHDTGTDVSGRILIDPDDGAITGSIPRDFDPNAVSMQVDLILAGPRGYLSDVGTTNRLTPKALVAPGNWPDVIQLAADKVVDQVIPATLSGGGNLTYIAAGLPAAASISNLGRLYWPTTIDDLGEHLVTLSVYKGELFDCNAFVIQVTDEPDPPVLQLAMQDSDYYVVSGSCTSWALIAQAAIVETGQTYKGNLKIDAEGNITGLLPKMQIQSDTVTLEVTLKGPNGTLSQPGRSNTFHYAQLVDFLNWPKDLTVREGDLVDIPSPVTNVPQETLTFSIEGLPQAATVDPATGHILWQTTSTDAGEYPARLIASNGVSYDFGQFTLTVEDDEIQELVITQCTLRAKGNRGGEKDFLEAAGSFSIPAVDLLNVSYIHIKIAEGQPCAIDVKLPFKATDVKNGLFAYKSKNGDITKFELDVYTGQFKITANNIDLTAVKTPIKFEIDMGDIHGIGYAADYADALGSGGALEDVINGNKHVPVQLLIGNTDLIQLTKTTFRSRSGVNTLTLIGNIALKNPYTDMNDDDLTISWANEQGSYSTTINKNKLLQKGKRSIFTFRSSRNDPHPVQSAMFNLEKGTFKIVINDSALPDLSGSVNFGLSFGDFDQGTITFIATKTLKR